MQNTQHMQTAAGTALSPSHNTVNTPMTPTLTITYKSINGKMDRSLAHIVVGSNGEGGAQGTRKNGPAFFAKDNIAYLVGT